MADHKQNNVETLELLRTAREGVLAREPAPPAAELKHERARKGWEHRLEL